MHVLAQGGEAFGVGVLVSAFLFGFRHGIDWDHIAAITDITSSQEDRRASVVFGTLYALGHALVVFAIGSAAILLGAKLPESVDPIMERIVGFTLVILGVFVFASLIKHGRDFRMRSRWMLIFSGVRSAYRKTRSAIGRPNGSGAEHSHDDLDPIHLHADDGMAVAVAEDLPVSEWHHGHHGRPGHHHHKHPEPDAFMEYGRGTAFVVGMVHGVGAETPTQVLIFLTAVTAGGKAAGEAVLAHVPGRAARVEHDDHARVDLRVPARVAELEDLRDRGGAHRHLQPRDRPAVPLGGGKDPSRALRRLTPVSGRRRNRRRGR